MKTKQIELLMGNEAIGRGLIEAGCQVAAAYPGTPSTEILQSVINRSEQAENPLHIEWSVNEKIAFEVALAASYTGKRSVSVMKQVGLNVAADPFMRTAYLGIKGGMITIVADDPGPHSSQTEQDTRLFCMQGRVPVLDPSSPAEAKAMIEPAYTLSEKYEMNVVLRPTTRICHSRQSVELKEIKNQDREPAFKPNPARWIGTPNFMPALHTKLNENLVAIAAEEEWQPKFKKGDGSYQKTALVASGIAYACLLDLLNDLDLIDKVDLFQVTMPYPLSQDFTQKLHKDYDRVLVLEETYPVIELQLAHPGGVGKQSGDVPKVGELTPDVIHGVVSTFLNLNKSPEILPAARGQRPSLCPGCPHRAAFYSIKSCFPNGIFPSDIGCYTLGMNLEAVHTVHCMGACISQGAGFYQAYSQNKSMEDIPPIVVTIGDSTFFHAGIPALINAVVQQSRIVLVILDNSTTAMTGGQPVPHMGLAAGGKRTKTIAIEPLVKASGVDFLESCDPYDHEKFEATLKKAHEFTRSESGGVAVVISKRPCIMSPGEKKKAFVTKVVVGESCIGCETCVDDFECPAISMVDVDEGEVKKKSLIDQDRCIGCGNCIPVCPIQAIEAREGK